jgi:O-antigen/teichoic acid export membrane protein
MGDGLKNKMINGLAWTTVNVFGVQAIQLVIGIFLARILNIEDFGKVGILFFFVGISTVFIDGGFGQALIRKQDATEKDTSTIFFLNLLVSVSLYLVLFFSAPFIANFFHQPELELLARVLFLSIIVFSFYFVQYVNLLKKLDYKSIAIINILSVVLSSLVAMVLALQNVGVWVLVFQQLSFHTFKAIISPFFLRWRPIWAFSKQTIVESWKFSVGIFGQTFLNAIFNNIFTLLIGKFDTIRNVGLYTQANKYSETVNTASNSVLTTGTYPIFAQIQNDDERLLRVYRKVITSVTLLTFPLVAFLIATAEPLIISLISSKWLESVILFQILILGNLFYPVYTVNVNVLNARGESKNTFRLEVFKKSLITLFIVLSYGYGIKIMLLGLLLANFISFLASMILVKKSLQYYFKHQFFDLFKTLLIAIVCGLIVAPINLLSLKPILLVAIQGVTFAALYLLLAIMFYPEKWLELKVGVRKKLNKSSSL